MSRVLLISPLCEHPRYPLYFPSENLGIAYIASHLRNRGIETDIFDANMYGIPASDICRYFDVSNYILIGIASSSFLLINETARIAQNLKANNPHVHVTVGGHFATFTHLEILEYEKAIDSVVRGEGEETTFHLINQLKTKDSLSSIDGLTYRDSTGAIVINKPRELIADLNQLEWPARDTLVYLKSLGHSWPTQVTTSRGCYANCSFCDIRAFSGTLWRARSAPDIVNEMEYLQKEFGSNIFRFTDDEFIGPKPHGPKRAKAMAEEIIRRGLNIKLMIDARAHMVDKELFSLLKEAGVFDCLIGIESGVDRILKLYNKGINVETNKRAILTLKEIGIDLNLAFIMFDPRMTFDELRQNYQFLKDYDIVSTDSLKSWIWPLDGTPLRKILLDGGWVSVKNFDEFYYEFSDSKVGDVFNFITEVTRITFQLERELYSAKKYLRLTKDDLKLFQERNLELWIQIFEYALETTEEFAYDWIEKKVNKLLNDLCSKMAKLSQTQLSTPMLS